MQHLMGSLSSALPFCPPFTTDVGAAAAVGNGWEIQNH